MHDTELEEIYYAYIPEIDDLLGKQPSREVVYGAMRKITNGIRDLLELAEYWQLSDETLCKLINIAADIAYE